MSFGSCVVVQSTRSGAVTVDGATLPRDDNHPGMEIETSNSLLTFAIPTSKFGTG
jgi:hypothetical protein